ncbi:hypothetical protein [Dyella sp. OK004]|uniref:hypothetical protein n=1 Tax=Dyella sp. OK004 TaxID=1855292 RepID=UPI000B8983C6|nr:hypothetical protein [Dyella sp. OK004]
MDFQIDRFEPSGLIVGRNGYADIPLGTVFVAVTKCRVDGKSPELSTVDLGDVATIELRLTEVQWFRRSLEVIPNGHAAGIRLEGMGLEAIAAALATKRDREFISIRT